MTDLKVFRDGCDFWVATDIQDAKELRAKWYGFDSPEAHDAAEEPEELRELVGTINILCNAEGHPDDDGEYVERPAREWAEREGRGMLCSTEW